MQHLRSTISYLLCVLLVLGLCVTGLSACKRTNQTSTESSTETEEKTEAKSDSDSSTETDESDTGSETLSDSSESDSSENAPGGNENDTSSADSSAENGDSETTVEETGTTVEETTTAENRVVDHSSVQAMLNHMTLKEKIAQMIMVRIDTYDGAPVQSLPQALSDAFSAYGFGGVILFGQNMQSSGQICNLTNQLQAAAKSSAYQIPLFIATDQEGGTVWRMPRATNGPGNMALAATGDPANAQIFGSIFGSELASVGINVDFAPDADVNNNPSNPVIGVRSFSDDPNMTATYTQAYIAGLHGTNTIATLKHFPGHGDTATDSHYGLPTINKSLAQLEATELIPFKAGIAAGADMVMTAHITFPQIDGATPATMSKKIITDVLRNRLGFKGVVVTDSLNMGAITQHFSQADVAKSCINAGVDLLLSPFYLRNAAEIQAAGAYIDSIATMVSQGLISESMIDEAVTRLLTLKFNRGIMTRGNANAGNAAATVGSGAHLNTELAIAKKAVTLLKNDGNVLPLREMSGKHVLVLVQTASLRNTVESAIQAHMSVANVSSECEFIVKCADTTPAAAVTEDIAHADTVILVGSISSQSGLVAAASPAAGVFQLALATAKEASIPVVFLSTRLPYDAGAYRSASSILLSYSNNMIAAFSAIFGETNPTGKLPVNLPEVNGDMTFSGTVLYPRGFGLSY